MVKNSSIFVVLEFFFAHVLIQSFSLSAYAQVQLPLCATIAIVHMIPDVLIHSIPSLLEWLTVALKHQQNTNLPWIWHQLSAEKQHKKVRKTVGRTLGKISFLKTFFLVYGIVRVVRGCGYITDDRDDKDCMKRSGTHDVHALVKWSKTEF